MSSNGKVLPTARKSPHKRGGTQKAEKAARRSASHPTKHGKGKTSASSLYRVAAAATAVIAEAPPAQIASTSAPASSLPDTSQLERAVEAVKATLPASASREELRKDPIYRIMHALPRSDVLEVVRSSFAAPHCARAAAYMDLSYMKNPLRRLRLQIGCDGPTGMHLFFPRIAVHRHTLRVVDLSRNRLSTEDVVLLCNVLGFGQDGSASKTFAPADDARAAASSAPLPFASPSPSSSCLELLDLSYNTKVGNEGVLHALRALRRCASIRAVIFKSVGLDDTGALAVSDILRRWPAPKPAATTATGLPLLSDLLRPSTASTTKFFLNLNENYIEARGTYVLGKGLPEHVSLTVIKQRPALLRHQRRGGEAAVNEEQR